MLADLPGTGPGGSRGSSLGRRRGVEAAVCRSGRRRWLLRCAWAGRRLVFHAGRRGGGRLGVEGRDLDQHAQAGMIEVGQHAVLQAGFLDHVLAGREQAVLAELVDPEVGLGIHEALLAEGDGAFHGEVPVTLGALSQGDAHRGGIDLLAPGLVHQDLEAFVLLELGDLGVHRRGARAVRARRLRPLGPVIGRGAAGEHGVAGLLEENQLHLVGLGEGGWRQQGQRQQQGLEQAHAQGP